MSSIVENFFNKPGEVKWKPIYEKMREIVLSFPLEETLRWGQPCYMYEGSNVILFGGFKEYCALLFVKGALMKDPDGILIQQTEHVQEGRQIRFTTLEELEKREPTVRAYVAEAIEVQKSGREIVRKTTADYPVPEEFQAKLDAMPELKAAYDKLTPGRQRGYLYYFAGAKQSKTREARVEKYIPQILAGKGIDD